MLARRSVPILSLILLLFTLEASDMDWLLRRVEEERVLLAAWS